MSKKTRIIILSIIILILSTSLLYISYGYITSKIFGNETSKIFSNLSQILKIEYSDGTETLSSDGQFIPGATLTKTFTITNKSNIDLDFSIDLTNITNDFKRPEDLVYELYLEDNLLITDTFPNEDKTIAYNQVINQEETLNYTLKIIYVNSEENQIIDQGKSISATISFSQQTKSIANLQILGNSEQKTYSEENLLDISLVETGTFDTTTGEPIESSLNQYRTTNYIEVVAGSKLIQTNSYSNNMRMFCWGKDDKFIDSYLLTHNTTFTFSEDCKIKFVSSSGGFPNDTTIKLTYIPPTTDTPIEILSVGNKTKNLVNVADTTVGWAALNNELKDQVNSLPAGTYTLSAMVRLESKNSQYDNYTDNQAKIFFRNSDKSFNVNSSVIYWKNYDVGDSAQVFVTFTLTEDTVGTISHFYLYGCGSGSYGETGKGKFYNVQIEKGANLSKFEPYNKIKIPLKFTGTIDGQYEVVGTPTITEDLIVSNFSSSSYINTGYQFTPGDSTWEYHVKITTPASSSGTGGIVGGLGNKAGCTPFYYANGNWATYLSSTGSSWDLLNGIIIMPLSPNTTYWLKTTYNGSSYIYSYSLDGKEWTIAKTFTKNATVYGGLTVHLGNNRGQNSPFKGTIDLSSFYIKIDDKVVYGSDRKDINIYLDEPLRKIGNYADYIDFKNGKIVRNIKSDYITSVLSKSSATGTYGLFLSEITEKPLLIYDEGAVNTTQSKGISMSNKFIQSSNTYNKMTNYPNIITPYITSANENRVAYTLNDTTITTVEAAQEKIGDGFQIDYVMETPIEEQVDIHNVAEIDPSMNMTIDTEVQPTIKLD